MRKITKRSAAILAATAVAVGGAGAAWAFNSWGDGNGTATGQAATITPITATGELSTKLIPGKWSDVKMVATNTNEYDVRITGATLKTVVVKNGGLAGCNQDTAHLIVGAVASDDVLVPKGGVQKKLGTFTQFVGMTQEASALCAGATFEVKFDLTGVAA